MTRAEAVDSPARPRGERRHELDALRVLAVLALLLYHASRPFDAETWHVKNVERSLGLELFGSLLTPWRLPLLFMISGLGTYYALGFRSAWRYARERLGRLLLPLAFGMAVVIVPQVYIERISAGMADRLSPRDFHGSYFAFYPQYFQGIYPSGNLSWHHLWFLAYLLVFSLVALPLFLYLRSEGGRRLTARAASGLAPGRRIFLLALPLALIHVALRGRFSSTHALVGDWWNLAHFFLLFLLGYVLLPQPAFKSAAEANRRAAAPLVKFTVISGISLGVTVALCEAVGLTKITRRLFGMKN